MELPLTRDTSTLRNPSGGVSAKPHFAISDLTTEAAEPETPHRTHRRFDRAARLFTEPGLQKLMAARVLVVGVGGVGSFAAEALARSGVGHISLIDFDRICITNNNRQLHCMKGTVGRTKVEVMAERLRLIHPTAEIEAVSRFYNAESGAELLAGKIDFVVDAIDNLTAKAHLLASCLQREIPVVSAMGAAARIDPTRIRIDDLSNTEKDPFAKALRKLLKDRYGILAVKHHPIGVQAVFSMEEPREPAELSYDEGGFQCVCPGGKNGLNDCDRKARIDGTAAFVTGSFGLIAASVVVRGLLAA